MFFLRNKKILLLATIVTGMLFSAHLVFAITQNINVNMTVPVNSVCSNGVREGAEGCDAGGANGVCPAACSASCTVNVCGAGVGPPVDFSPSIANVGVVVGINSATIVWNANDDVGLTAVGFVYGLTNQYGSNGAVGGNYSVSLGGLTAATRYFYKISVTDTVGHVVNYEADFTTQAIPPPVVEPIISNVVIVAGKTGAQITWDTNVAANSQISYGLTDQYGSTALDNNLILAHTINLVNLLPNTTYHFRVISVAADQLSVNTADISFSTLTDNVPPPDVDNLNLQIGQNNLSLIWQNPNLGIVPDFVGVKILRKVGSQSNNVTDGTVVYNASGQAFTDNAAVVGVDYFYTVFSYDTSGNYSGGAFSNGRIPVPPAIAEICNDNADNDGDGLIDCADQSCADFLACVVRPAQEICGNAVDDDNNGWADCLDPVCAAAPVCALVLPIGVQPAEKNAFGAGANVPEFLKINPRQLIYLTANRRLILTLSPENELTGLSGFPLTIAIPKEIVKADPTAMVLIIDGQEKHSFVYSEKDRRYYADVIFSEAGRQDISIYIEYGAEQRDVIDFSLRALSLGAVKGDGGEVLEGATVSLFIANGELADLAMYGQMNPKTIDAAGLYGWAVANGSYYIKVENDGYFVRQTGVFIVENNVVNKSLVLVKKPRPLLETIDPTASVAENILFISKNVGEKVVANVALAGQAIQNIRENTEIEKAVKTVVAPAAVGVSAVAANAFSGIELLAWLRVIFLQPLLLLGRGKREKWGTVYNSLNKLPIALATVRLSDAITGKIIRSRVTDMDGRYIFLVGPGKYNMSVQKDGFIFPSALLKGVENDGKRNRIYHGDTFEVTSDGGVISATMPTDPVGVELKTPSRIVRARLFNHMKSALSWVGILATAASFALFPTWYLGALFTAHVVVFYGFLKFSGWNKGKEWGVVYDETTKKPIKRAVARLFDSQFNKLVETQVTDHNGKYNFLVGDNKYYVTYDHENYELYKSDVLDLSEREKGTIDVDAGLKKK